mmetsp:Transcript_2614/g.16863  ORF Transcript_2614/g.16863 Transcript_2614/m.16863 type:complete len:219 (+) Transcript_2614:1709-2365(+)
MLSSLPATLKSCLKLANTSSNDQNANICLRRSMDHVWNVVFVPRGIQDRVSFFFSGEVGPPNFHSLALCTLFFVRIHDVSHVPAFPVLIFRFLFIFLDGPVVHHTGKEQDLSTQSRLSCIHVPDEDNIEVLSRIKFRVIYVHFWTFLLLFLGFWGRSHGLWFVRQLGLFHFFGHFLCNFFTLGLCSFCVVFSGIGFDDQLDSLGRFLLRFVAIRWSRC